MMKILLMAIWVLFSSALFSTEVHVIINGKSCNISGECYNKINNFERFQIEDALAESKVCFKGDPAGVLEILIFEAEFSDEHSYLEISNDKNLVEIAYYDAYMHEQEEGGEPTVESIKYCTLANIELSPCTK